MADDGEEEDISGSPQGRNDISSSLLLMARSFRNRQRSSLAPTQPWLLEIDSRALIDLDPVFTQIRHPTDPEAHEQAMQHARATKRSF
jgi:hypothetical protein